MQRQGRGHAQGRRCPAATNSLDSSPSAHADACARDSRATDSPEARAGRHGRARLGIPQVDVWQVPAREPQRLRTSMSILAFRRLIDVLDTELSNQVERAADSRAGHVLMALAVESPGFSVGSVSRKSPTIPRPPPCASALIQNFGLVMSMGSFPETICFDCAAIAPSPVSATIMRRRTSPDWPSSARPADPAACPSSATNYG